MKLALLFLLTITLFSHTKQHQHKIDAVSSATLITIMLNEGEKWEANPETTLHVNAMIKIIQHTLLKEEIEIEVVAEQLNNEHRLLLSNCTMQGNARAQLHNFLLGFRYRLDHLKSDIVQIKEVEKYLISYHDYFISF